MIENTKRCEECGAEITSENKSSTPGICKLCERDPGQQGFENSVKGTLINSKSDAELLRDGRRHFVKNAMKQTIARWEAKGGKTWIELYKADFQGKPSYDYSSSNGGGNLGWLDSDQVAISQMESRTIQYMKIDYPSFKRVK